MLSYFSAHLCWTKNKCVYNKTEYWCWWSLPYGSLNTLEQNTCIYKKSIVIWSTCYTLCFFFFVFLMFTIQHLESSCIRASMLSKIIKPNQKYSKEQGFAWCCYLLDLLLNNCFFKAISLWTLLPGLVTYTVLLPDWAGLGDREVRPRRESRTSSIVAEHGLPFLSRSDKPEDRSDVSLSSKCIPPPNCQSIFSQNDRLIDNDAKQTRR